MIYGVPVGILAAVVKAATGSVPNTLQASQIRQIANNLSSAYQQSGGDPYVGSDADWSKVATKVFGGGDTQWQKKFDKVYDKVEGDTDDNRWSYGEIGTPPKGKITTPFIGGGVSGGETFVIPGGDAPAVPTTGENSPADIADIYQLFKTYLGRTPHNDAEAIGYGRVGRTIAQLRQELQGQPEAIQYRESLGKQNLIPWADNIFQQFLGRHATTAELDSIIRNGWNPEQTTTYLKSQPYGTTPTITLINGIPKVVTVGDVSNLKTAMTASYQKILGRDPTASELNFAAVNGVPTNHTDALAEQTRDKTVWAGDPDQYTMARANIQKQLAGYGIQVPVSAIDPKLVNQAVTGKWNDDQIRAAIGSGQAPGSPAGTTLDTYAATKKTAEGIWGSYFPNQKMPLADVNKYLGLTADQIAAQIGAMPSPDAQAAGLGYVPIQAYVDAKNAATQALAKFGVLGRDPTAAEIGVFAKQGSDVEAITKHYSTDAAVLAKNPGAQYGKSREGYVEDRAAIEGAYSKSFGETKTNKQAQAAKGTAATPAPAAPEPDWLKEVFQEGYDPTQTQTIFDDYFKRTGAAPTAQDIDLYKSRSKTPLEGEPPRVSTAAYGLGPQGQAATLATAKTGRR